MSAKHKRARVEMKEREGRGLTVARLIDVLRDLPGDAEVRAGDHRICVTGPYVAAVVYDSGEYAVEVDGEEECGGGV